MCNDKAKTVHNSDWTLLRQQSDVVNGWIHIIQSQVGAECVCAHSSMTKEFFFSGSDLRCKFNASTQFVYMTLHTGADLGILNGGVV